MASLSDPFLVMLLHPKGRWLLFRSHNYIAKTTLMYLRDCSSSDLRPYGWPLAMHGLSTPLLNMCSASLSPAGIPCRTRATSIPPRCAVSSVELAAVVLATPAGPIKAQVLVCVFACVGGGGGLDRLLGVTLSIGRAGKTKSADTVTRIPAQEDCQSLAVQATTVIVSCNTEGAFHAQPVVSQETPPSTVFMVVLTNLWSHSVFVRWGRQSGCWHCSTLQLSQRC